MNTPKLLCGRLYNFYVPLNGTNIITVGDNFVGYDKSFPASSPDFDRIYHLDNIQ